MGKSVDVGSRRSNKKKGRTKIEYEEQASKKTDAVKLQKVRESRRQKKGYEMR